MEDDARVRSYQKIASLGGWAGASRTLWAIGALGTFVGAAVGAMAPIFPVLVGAAELSLPVIGASAATFAAIGMGMGFSGGLMLGRISGSNSAIAEEQELRMKSWMSSQLKGIDPNFKEVIGQEATLESVQGEIVRDTKDFNWKDTYETYVNPRIGMVMAAVGAAAGIILSAAYLATGGSIGAVGPMLEPITGVANIGSAPAALTAYTAGVLASFGALWSLNFPKITSNITEFTGNLIGGKYFGRSWEPQREKALEHTSPDVSPTIEEAQQNTPSTSHGFTGGKEETSRSFQELLDIQREQRGTGIHIQIN